MFSLLEFVSICSVAMLTAAGASHGWNLLRHPRGSRSYGPTRSCEDDGSGRPSAGAWHEPRYDKRHFISSQIEYRVAGERHDGQLIDLSRHGWHARGDQPLAKGTTITLQVCLSDASQPLTIDEAVVRWTEGLEFGAELISISPTSAAMLSDYLSTHFPAPEPARSYAISPFSYN